MNNSVCTENINNALVIPVVVVCVMIVCCVIAVGIVFYLRKLKNS